MYVYYIYNILYIAFGSVLDDALLYFASKLVASNKRAEYMAGYIRQKLVHVYLGYQCKSQRRMYIYIEQGRCTILVCMQIQSKRINKANRKSGKKIDGIKNLNGTLR